MQISIDEMRALAIELMVQRGLSEEEANMVTAHLLEAELIEKPSHGFMRIPRICNRLETLDLRDITVHKETPVSCVLDGGNKPGFVVAYKAMQIALEKAKTQHLAVVGGFNTDNIGIVGFYARQVAAKGFIGIMTANSPAKIPPWGGVEPIMGTNPLTIGIPTREGSIVLDFASSKVTFGDVLLATKEDRRLPSGILLNEHGNPTTNPGDVRSGGIGSILAIADHKGAGLALMLEILAGPLVSAKGGRKAVPEGGWGFFMIVLDPGILTSTQDFYTKVDKMIAEIKNTKRARGVDEIFLPGERTARKLEKNAGKTNLDIPNRVMQEIKALQGAHAR